MRYLDPKNDLTFKKVFGEHPHLLMSFLNALLPLEEGQFITSLEYLPSDLAPRLPFLKYSIVDVRCVDNTGRQFIVEMQMLWTDAFKKRVLFNASKAYVKQLEKGNEYKGLMPVYALNLVNENFEHDTDQYYHHYSIIHNELTGKKIEGLEFVFIELPKFKAKNLNEKKLQILWLRYLTEIKDNMVELPDDLMANPTVREAIECLEESAFTPAQLDAYDKYWDDISSERTLLADSLEKGEKIGMEKGMEKGIQLTISIIRLHGKGFDASAIAKETGQSEDAVKKVLLDSGLL
ncbi:MAG: Rpn family recombination-promoting nuclease/putative transposase [Saprospiraceae bacterium]